jgi:peroxiredoxin
VAAGVFGEADGFLLADRVVKLTCRIVALKSYRNLAEAFDEICMMDAPLNVRLAAYADRLRELNFPFAEAYDELVARLYAGEIGREAPMPGRLMPPFILPSKAGTLVSLQELLGAGPLVISFNRGHWCPFCKIELRTIASYHQSITAEGASVVSIMPDRQQFVGDLRDATANAIEILTDMDNGYAMSLGLVMWLGENVKQLMIGRGYHLETYQGGEGWYVPLPATFVVAQNGIIVTRYVDPDFRKRMEIREILDALRVARSMCSIA